MMKNRHYTFVRGVTPFGPPMWQAEADTELTLSASPTTAMGQKALALAKRRYSTVLHIHYDKRALIYRGITPFSPLLC